MSEMDSSGAESASLVIKNKYALVIGTNTSKHTPELRTLQYAESDATKIADSLGQQACNFVHTTPALIGEHADTQAVREAVVNLTQGKNQSDLLLFYFIGHGYSILTDNEDAEVYLVTADFKPDLAQHDPTSHLSLGWLRRMLFKSDQAANIIIFLDCCAAGNILQNPSPEQQLLQSLEKFMLSLKQPESSHGQHHPSWAIITSTSANAASYEEMDRNGEGHARMTGLILKALQGNVPETLDSGQHLTLGRLYEYSKQMTTTMDRSGSPKQNLIMDGSFRHNLILAYHPTADVPSTDPDNPPPNPSPIVLQPHFDATFCPSAAFADLDIEQLRTFLKEKRVLDQNDYRGAHNEQEKLKLSGMLQGEHPSYGALLCFGHNPSQAEAQSGTLPGVFTRCFHWDNEQRRGEPEADQEYRGSLLKQFSQVLEFLQQHLGNQVSREQQSGKLYYRVLEEAVANALIHREYITEHNNRPQARGIMVEIFSNRIEISNPGEPLVGVEALQEALQEGSKRHLGSHPRNPQITRIFRLAHRAEEAGTGVMRIQQWTEDTDLQEPTIEFNERTHTLTLTLFRYSANHHREPDPAKDPKPLPNNKDAGLLLPNFPRKERTQTRTLTLLRNSASHNKAADYSKDIRLLPDNDEKPGDLSQDPTKILKIVENEQNNKGSSDALLPLSPPVHNHNNTKATLLPLYWKRTLLFLLSIFIIFAVLVFSLNTFGIISISVPFLSAHTLSPPLAPASTTIEIASDFPTSGLNATSESPLQYGAQMAINEANHESLLPGYTLKPVSYDDTGSGNRPDPRVGASNIQHAIADNLVAGIVGPGNSMVAQAELPLANQAPIALISPNTTYPCLTKGSTSDPGNCSGGKDIQALVRPTDLLTYFRLATTDDLQGKAVADYFYTILHYRKVLILNDYSDLYSSGLASTFQGEWTILGGQATPLALSENTSTIQDYQTALQNTVSNPPDLIYFAGDDPNGTYVLQALANIPALQNVALAGGDGIVDNNFLTAATQFHPNAPVYASLPIQDPSFSGTAVGIDFQQNYVASGYSNYRAYAASSYDCTMMLIQAIKMALQKVSTPHGPQDATGAKQFRLAVLRALAHLTYTGATGKQSFDTNGDTTNHTITFYQLDLSNPQASWRWISQVSA